MHTQTTVCTAFEGSQRIASGALDDVANAAKTAFDRALTGASHKPILIFEDATSETIELDWRGSAQEFAARVAAMPRGGSLERTLEAPEPYLTAPPDPPPGPTRGPGRPRMGVVAREVTLLPRHWEWLASQPGGASVALRKLVDGARHALEGQDRVRQARQVGYKFMATMAGHEAGFEEASRALFAGDQTGFEALIAAWPVDVQAHLKKILTGAF